MEKVNKKTEIFSKILEIYQKTKNLEKSKRLAGKFFSLPKMPKNYEILKFAKEKNVSLEEKIHKIRSLSGIVSVSVLTKPFPCRFKCAFCPKEKGMPQSYLSQEPAAERAKSLNFDPYLQVRKRLETLKISGHSTDKIELIILGSTFSLLPKRYRIWFLKRCFDGANNKESKNLKEAQFLNEKAKNRIIGITIETRPDLINEEEIKFLRELGVTRVELGAQSFFNFILKKNERGHQRKDLINATFLLKETGFKVVYHIMLNLPYSNPLLDILSSLLFFYLPPFKPDQIKIYPLMVVKGSKIYNWFREGKIKIYDKETLIKTLAAIKRLVPSHVRISRIIRDIPSPKIESEMRITNLRENVQYFLKSRGLRCKCIRCREIREGKIKFPILKIKKYIASKGKEFFISIEDKKTKKLASFLRLRIPYFLKNNKPIFDSLKNCALIREIHTYGRMLELGETNKKYIQHQGFGIKLIKEAEKIAKIRGAKKIAVIAGVGAREYFRKNGYTLKDTYMIKDLK